VQRQAKAHLTDVLLQQTEPGRQPYQTLQGQFQDYFAGLPTFNTKPLPASQAPSKQALPQARRHLPGACFPFLEVSVVSSHKTVGCYLAERLHEPEAEYWRSSTSQQELLSKPPLEAVFIDGPEQVVAYFQQLRPVPDAYRRYLPDASRVDRLPSYGGYGLIVLPVPLVSAEEGLTQQVQARSAGGWAGVLVREQPVVQRHVLRAQV